ncbi:TorF family putative porin [Melioribacteraceae bacterium 4301-Me]|uniref:TorF family putative porin n=1 Tax=Pyranulibacter aquaticus TaxID=3163344 RepID=UPI003595905C
MNTLIKKLSLIILFTYSIILTNQLKAQELSVGTDLVSRYIWRGIDLGQNTPSLQPNIKFTFSDFNFGFWGAYSLSNPNGLNEIDIYTSYSLSLTKAGTLSLGFTDYTNPNSGTKIGNIHNHNDPEGPGAHFIELNINYAAPQDIPISLSFNYFLYNVANNPIYFQLNYTTAVSGVDLNLFLGGTPGDNSKYYGVSNFSIINLGFTASKSVKITESFSFPLFGSIILNPSSENLFYVIGISM